MESVIQMRTLNILICSLSRSALFTFLSQQYVIQNSLEKKFQLGRYK